MAMRKKIKQYQIIAKSYLESELARLPKLPVSLNAVISDGNSEYRVLSAYDEYKWNHPVSMFVLVELHIAQIKIRWIPVLTIDEGLKMGEWHICDCQEVIDTENEDYRRLIAKSPYPAIMDVITDTFGPSYKGMLHGQNNHKLNEIIDRAGVSRPTVLKYLRWYLQSGCDKSVLIDHRAVRYSDVRRDCQNALTPLTVTTRQRLSPSMEKVFERYAQGIHSGQYSTVMDAYDAMTKNGENNEFPSYHTFYRYVNRNIPRNARPKVKKRKVRVK